MKQKIILSLFAILLCGCSAHQISFSVPAAKSSANKMHFSIGVYASDSLVNYPYFAIPTGGLCTRHEYQLDLGKGIISAISQAIAGVCDSVIILSSITDAFASGKIKYIATPEILRTIANVDFSNAAFSVNIKAKIEQNIVLHLRDIHNADIELPPIHIDSESGGKGQDCHDAVPYLKSAGDAAMIQLRDSVISRLSHL